MLTNLGKLIDGSKAPDEVAIIDCYDIDHPRTFTHGEIDRLADACARGLWKRGMQAGAAIGLLSLNRVEFVIAYLGIMRAGMVAVPINHKLPAAAISSIASDCRAELVFTDCDRNGLLPQSVDTICFDNPEWQDFLDPGAFKAVHPDDSACAMILYTSGSTGRPKGVQLSHDGQLWALRSRLSVRRSFTDERIIVAAPLFHMNALISLKFALASHASLVLLPHFHAGNFIRAIGQHRVTWITSVPAMMAMVVKEKEALDAIDTSYVRYVRMGSAAATGRLYDSVKAAFPNADVAGGYGTTEAGPVVFGPTGGRALPTGGGLGWPLEGVEVRLVAENGQESDEGELWMRTPANMLGYLNLPEKTAQVLTPDRWYKSGDIFRRDAAGCYYFVGRADDMFNCGGENVYPSEVEEIISRLPEVMQVCVVPVRDELKGEKPVAFVVPRTDGSMTEEAVKRHVLDNAPAYQHPRRVFFVASLPLSPTNKIDRKLLIRQADGLVQEMKPL